MKVIVASFPKCGTKTLHRALEILGYKVHDFDDQAFHHPHEWLQMLKYGTEKDVLKKMYENVDATCDFPASFYWEELSEAFPDAKIILTMRSNEDEWYASFRRQLDLFSGSLLWRSLHVLTPTGRRSAAVWKQLGHVMLSCPPQSYGTALENPNAQIQKRRYREHNASVLHRTPKDKLLVFNLCDGWEPMCQFLGKEIPNVPFPHENAKGVIAETAIDLPIFAQMRHEFQVLVALFVLLGSILFYLCYWKL